MDETRFSHCTATLIAFRYSPVIIQRILSIVLYVTIFVNEVHNAESNNKTEPSSADIEVITKSALSFPINSTAKGFEVVVRKYNDTENTTIFSSVHIPDHIIEWRGSDDEKKDLIIFPGGAVMKVPFKNVTTFIVLRAGPQSSSRYTSHLAYVRNFEKEVSVEWDVYSIHFHTNNGSFAQAFFPVREGPVIVTIGLGYTLTRSRRGDGLSIIGQPQLAPPSYNRVSPRPVYSLSKNGSQYQGHSIPPNVGTQLQRPPVPPQFPRLLWSARTTERHFGTQEWTTSSGINGGDDATTEYPMYGETGEEANSFGFTTHPPWSEFRLQETNEATTEGINDPSHSRHLTKLCFGLRRNCGNKPVPKQKIAKACIFGLRCKDSSFVDRYAIDTTSTTPLPMDGENDMSPKTKTKKKKKKMYTSLEDCVEAQSKKGRAMKVKHSNHIIASTSPPTIISSSTEKNGKTIAEIRKELVAEELTKMHSHADIKHQLDNTLTANDTQSLKHSKRETGREKKYHTKRFKGRKRLSKFIRVRGKRYADPCAEYRPEVGKSYGESLMNIEDSGVLTTSTTPEPELALRSTTSPTSMTGEQRGGTDQAVQVTAKTLPPDVKEASNPFSNSLGGNGSTTGNGQSPWDESMTETVKLQSIDNDVGEKITASSTDLAENGTSTPKTGSQLASEAESLSNIPSANLSTRQTANDLLETFNDEIKNEPTMDAIKPKKNDSDAKDVLNLDIPFIGIGDCDFVQLNFTSPLPTDKVELIKFFLTVLKEQCSTNIMSKTLQLFDDKLVIFHSPINITVNRDNVIFQKKILDEIEWSDVASAILLSQFFTVFREQHTYYNSNTTNNKSPDGKRISGTVKTLTILTSRILDLLQSTEKLHAIKFANLLLVILQAQRSELTTNGAELNRCVKCKEEKSVNFNSMIQLYSLMRFIVDRLQDIVVSSNKTEESFNNFFISNVLSITQLVKDKTPFVY